MRRIIAASLGAFVLASFAAADVIVNYTVDLGGNNPNPLNGLGAKGTFSISGTSLKIVLENTSTGVPLGFDSADQLLSSLGMNFSGGVSIVSGDSALISPGSVGVGGWSGLVAGDDVSDQWAWTNDGGGDLLELFTQVVSTSASTKNPVKFSPGGSRALNGPSGGMAASPPLVNIPGAIDAVSNSISYTLTLSGTLTEAELEAIANASIVEFGSDARYLGVPEPSTLALLLGGALAFLRRR